MALQMRVRSGRYQGDDERLGDWRRDHVPVLPGLNTNRAPGTDPGNAGPVIHDPQTLPDTLDLL